MLKRVSCDMNTHMNRPLLLPRWQRVSVTKHSLCEWTILLCTLLSTYLTSQAWYTWHSILNKLESSSQFSEQIYLQNRILPCFNIYLIVLFPLVDVLLPLAAFQSSFITAPSAHFTLLYRNQNLVKSVVMSLLNFCYSPYVWNPILASWN
jgi:hypothetical protein